MKKLLFLGALILGVSAISSNSAVLYPSVVEPIRSAIADEVDVLTNSPALTPDEARQLRLLKQARRNIERAGRPSLFGDVQILASLTTSLTHAFPDGEFDPLLQFAILDYRDLLLEAAFNLQTTIGGLPPSSSSTLASNTVENVITSLEQLDPLTSVGTGIQTLARAASRLRSAEGYISRASRSSTNRSNHMTAFVDSRRFVANTVGGISASYSPGSQTLTIVGRETGGTLPGNRSIQLVLNNVVAGTTTHSLGAAGTGSYAVYSASSPTNSIGLNSASGNVIVNLNATSGLVSGRFSFEAGDPFNGQERVRVTGGDFSAQLPTQ